MILEKQLLFFFSALGAFNGFLLTIYLFSKVGKSRFSNYFLPLLLLMLSIRVIKSVFFYFNRDLANIFIQFGLSACILIGPFLYLYFRKFQKGNQLSLTQIVLNLLPWIVIVSVLGILYPYVENRKLWARGIVQLIYLQWLIYILLSFKTVFPFFKNVSRKKQRKNIDIWLVSIYTGVFLVWTGYTIGSYKSYIVGALTFSFILYLIVLLFAFRYNRDETVFSKKIKYKDKFLGENLAEQIDRKLEELIQTEFFLNKSICLEKTAALLSITKHTFSQYLNEKKGKNFTTFINELRIEKAKNLLAQDTKFSIEGIGFESGFKSKSTFFNAFKKVTGTTPSAFQKAIQ